MWLVSCMLCYVMYSLFKVDSQKVDLLPELDISIFKSMSLYFNEKDSGSLVRGRGTGTLQGGRGHMVGTILFLFFAMFSAVVNYSFVTGA